MRTSFNQYSIGGKCTMTNSKGEKFICTIRKSSLHGLVFDTKDKGKHCIIPIEKAINLGWSMSPAE